MTNLRIFPESSLGQEGRSEGRDPETLRGERADMQKWEIQNVFDWHHLFGSYSHVANNGSLLLSPS